MICQLEKNVATEEFILVKIPKIGIYKANNIQEVADLLNTLYIVGPLRKISNINFSAKNHFVGFRSISIFHVKVDQDSKLMKKINNQELEIINEIIPQKDQDLKYTN